MARRRDGGPDGACIVDKPAGWTSHDVVAAARRRLDTRRVGHAGTLDPMATGVLVLGVGRATRLLTFVTGVDKTYEAEIRFGVETDTLDADGEVLVEHDMSLDPAEVQAAARSLTGQLMQVPPMVSALKVDGRRLHELARDGIEVERAPRPVRVDRFDVAPTADPLRWTAKVTCSSGTYVRVLAADLGAALGGGAHLAALRRTSVGPFPLEDAAPLDSAALLAPRELVRHLAQVTVPPEVADVVVHGRVLELDQLPGATADDGPWAVADEQGSLLAVYAPHGHGRAKPAVVLPTEQAG